MVRPVVSERNDRLQGRGGWQGAESEGLMALGPPATRWKSCPGPRIISAQEGLRGRGPGGSPLHWCLWAKEKFQSTHG